MATSDDGSFKSLWGQLSTGISDLFQSEIRLAKTELSEKTDQVTKALLAVAGGLFIALAALVILLQAVVVALSDNMDPAMAALLVGVIAAIIGLVLVIGGAKGLKPANLEPRRTVNELRRDQDLAKEHMHDTRTQQ